MKPIRSLVLASLVLLPVACGGTLPGIGASRDGGTAGHSNDGGPEGAAGAPEPGAFEWAHWPMPNPPSTGLPNPASYDTSTAGVVIDKVTGLTWQRAIDQTNTYTWADAEAYCANLTLAGHGDWRLPSAIELYSLVDYTKFNPAIDATAFPDTPAVFFWSSSPLVGNSSSAWVVYFDNGHAGNVGISGTGRVRCVRSPGADSPAPSYSSANGTVTDKSTKLVWQQKVAPIPYSWSGARTYCASLAIAGGGWRVPSVKELATLVDFKATSSPTIDTTAFPDTPADFLWSSSPLAGSSTSAWVVSFQDGSTHYRETDYTNPLRCVR